MIGSSAPFRSIRTAVDSPRNQCWCDASFPTRLVNVPSDQTTSDCPYHRADVVNATSAKITNSASASASYFIASCFRIICSGHPPDRTQPQTDLHSKRHLCPRPRPTRHRATNLRSREQLGFWLRYRRISESPLPPNFLLALSRPRPTMASASGNTGWAQLRQQARSLESQVSQETRATIN